MPTCQHCKRKWTWRESFKNSFEVNSGMTCPYCKTTQYVTTQSKRKSGLLNFLPPLTLLIPAFFPISLLTTLIILTGTSIFVIIIYPLLMELTSKEEPLW